MMPLFNYFLLCHLKSASMYSIFNFLLISYAYSVFIRNFLYSMKFLIIKKKCYFACRGSSSWLISVMIFHELSALLGTSPSKRAWAVCLVLRKSSRISPDRVYYFLSFDLSSLP